MDLVSKASMIERTLKINAEDFNQKKRNASQGNHYGEQPPHVNKRRFNHPPERNHAPQQFDNQGGGGQRPLCQKCGRTHGENCLFGQSVCFRCGKPGHLPKDCRTPANNQAGQSLLEGQRNTAPTRVYTLTSGDANASNEVVTCTLSNSYGRALVLFDARATHSCVSYSIGRA
ncbi:uncharacterized protein LOC133866223 [Alnus glutinosa]|uniref:uncharacterized protein LOC133866223 n=1 Tax=Alnus glutinosa TaxID=3517 RepID=UPI002D799E5C|nr:uncharacterized protein LOC133866223 [Alnus glutinosa]